MRGVITSHDWTKWASIFGDDGGFEIYETSTKTYRSNERYTVVAGPARQMLETREVLDDIKTRFFELDELTFGFHPCTQKEKYLMFFLIFLIQLKPLRQPVKADMRADAALQVYFSDILHSGPLPRQCRRRYPFFSTT